MDIEDDKITIGEYMLNMIIRLIKSLPYFYFESERLDSIIWNDKKANVLEIRLFGNHIGYF